jgi:isopentenyl diphosphate isomerase/L-lactate dehydrogenase-like FMN-dependent dehydrogenase
MTDDSLAVRCPNVRLLREAARARLPKPVFDFADGGAEDEVTLRGNEDAFRRWRFLPRPLEGAATRDQSVTLFGRTLASPVLIGPTGLAGLFWPRGEIASARAAAAASTVYCQSHGSVCSIEELAAHHDGVRWMQVFVYRDRAFTRELTQRARDAGCHALVLTVDNQLLGRRERDLANGFSIPPRFSARQSLAMAAKWRWAWSMRRELRTLTFGNYVRPGSNESLATLAGRMGTLLDPAMNWDDVAQLRAQWRGPLLVKGVLHPDDAHRAVAMGIDGLIVSNHGGRQVDGAASALDALPAIVAAVGDRAPVLVDGGIRRGSDVVKAIALGARAVLVARPQLWGLAVAGEAGVAHVLSILRAEIDRVMGLLGAHDLDALRRLDLLVPCAPADPDPGNARSAARTGTSATAAGGAPGKAPARAPAGH